MINPTVADTTVIAHILSGLLASGHYTRDCECTNNELPEPIRSDLGKDWKETGLPTRFSSKAVEDAVMLWKELHVEIEYIVREQ